jgi:hypothetical protein
MTWLLSSWSCVAAWTTSSVQRAHRPVEPELVNTTGGGFHLPEDGVIGITPLDGNRVSFNSSDFLTTKITITCVTVHYHEVYNV